MQKQQKGIEFQHKVEMINRQKKYSKVIMLNHKPVVDPAKVDELQFRIHKLKNPVKFSLKASPGIKLRSIQQYSSENQGSSKLPRALYANTSALSKSTKFLPPMTPQ